MSFKKKSIINPKTLNADNFDKKIQSGTLLKILQDDGKIACIWVWFLTSNLMSTEWKFDSVT